MAQATGEAALRRELAGWTPDRDLPGLLHALGHFALIGGAAFLLHLADGSFWQAPATLLLGVAVIFLFAPLHETLHGTAFKTHALNVLLGWIAALAIVLPPTYFRYFHFAHHRFTQDPERDPELTAPHPRTLGGLAWRLTGLGYWANSLSVLARHCLGRVTEGYIPKAKRGRAVLEARVMAAFYILILAAPLALGSTVVIEYWLLPVILGQPALRLYLLAEHHGRPFERRMLANSRTTRTNALVRFLAWNMPFHAEHHLAPNVPFYRLPDAHALTRGEVVEICPSYLAFFRRIVSAIRRGELPAQ
jgi:fatty acid desaturase